MKRLHLLIIVLLFSLTGCGGGGAKTEIPSPARNEASIAGEKIGGEAMALFPTSTGDPLAGGKLFTSACAACHGRDMIQSNVIATKTDQELVEFIKVGGVPNEPVVMPPRGGNSWLNDDKLYDIVAYLRSLQK